MEKKINESEKKILSDAWSKRAKLRADPKTRAEAKLLADMLWEEGAKLREDGAKLWAESNRLWELWCKLGT